MCHSRRHYKQQDCPSVELQLDASHKELVREPPFYIYRGVDQKITRKENVFPAYRISNQLSFLKRKHILYHFIHNRAETK